MLFIPRGAVMGPDALIPMVISGIALLVAIASFVYTFSARPKIRMRSTAYMRGAKKAGIVLEVFNVGRRKVAIAEVGVPLDGGGMMIPLGKEVPGAVSPHVAAPCVLDAGGVLTFHFAYTDKEGEDLQSVIQAKGFVVTTLEGSRPWRDNGNRHYKHSITKRLPRYSH